MFDAGQLPSNPQPFTQVHIGGSGYGTGPDQVVWEQPPPNLTVAPQWLCPDLLRYEQIGAADGFRGRVVRAFFWLLKVWPT